MSGPEWRKAFYIEFINAETKLANEIKLLENLSHSTIFEIFKSKRKRSLKIIQVQGLIS